jgi:hypothetical protein
MNWKQISIDDKPTFDRFLGGKEIELSDYTFTNLFIWHVSRCTFFTVADDFLCVQEKGPGQPPFLLMPVGSGDVKSVMEKLLAVFYNRDRNFPFRMRAVSAAMKDQIEACLPGRFTITPEPDRFDYVYDVGELIGLEGSKYKTKRNHLNMFKETYRFSYHPLTPDLLQDVADAEIEWCKKRDCESEENLESEKKGILEATGHFDRLDFDGGLLKVDGKTVAFTFGEALTKDTVVIHIEKADPDIRGAYQMIHQQFLEHRWPNMKYVNREEDLGIEGLRKAKKSYNPCRMIEKYVIEEKAR